MEKENQQPYQRPQIRQDGRDERNMYTGAVGMLPTYIAPYMEQNNSFARLKHSKNPR